MFKNIVYTLVASSLLMTQPAYAKDNTLTCIVTDSVVIASMNGKPSRAQHLMGRVNIGHQFEIQYASTGNENEPFSLSVISYRGLVFVTDEDFAFVNAKRIDTKNFGSIFKFGVTEFLSPNIQNYFYDKVRVSLGISEMSIELENEKISLSLYDPEKGMWDGVFSRVTPSQVTGQSLRCRTQTSQHEAVLNALKTAISPE